MSKSFSQSCENNKQPILEQLAVYFRHCQHVLEIGSGTGQHAAFFAPRLPNLVWHTSDLPDNHASISAWMTASGAQNIKPPIRFVIGQDPWPNLPIDAVFSANTAHIMQPDEVQLMMAQIAAHLGEGGIFCQYGPMRLQGLFTSNSNRLFEQSLKAQGYGGIRDIDELILWGKGLRLIARIPMPANNFLLVWRK